MNESTCAAAEKMCPEANIFIIEYGHPNPAIPVPGAYSCDSEPSNPLGTICISMERTQWNRCLNKAFRDKAGVGVTYPAFELYRSGCLQYTGTVPNRYGANLKAYTWNKRRQKAVCDAGSDAAP